MLLAFRCYFSYYIIMNEKLPSKNKLTCTVTGAVVKVAPKVFDVRAAVYGSVEALRNSYVSATGRKLLCTGKTVAEIRAEYNVDESVSLPNADIVAKYTRWAKYRKLPKTNEEKTQIE